MIDAAEDAARRVEDFLTRRQLGLLLCWTATLFVAGVLISRARPFWFDEIFTWSIAHPGGSSSIIDQLRHQVDQQPPPFFWLTRLAFLFTSNEHIAARLPGVFGFWLMTVCVFRFVQRRGGVLLGSLAVGVILNTLAVRHFVEARPYGLVLGFSALALVSWQAASEPDRRLWSLAGIAVGIAGCVSSSYYGVLVVVPVALAELVRTATRRHLTSRAVDIRVWLALALGAATAIPWVPLALSGVSSLSGKNWATPHRFSFVGAYTELLSPLSLLILASAILIGIHTAVSAPWASRPATTMHFSWPEMAAVVTFALIPLIGLIVALVWINAYNARYVLVGVVGVGILLAIVAWNAVRGSPLVLLCLLVAAVFGAAANGARQFYYGGSRQPANSFALADVVSGQPASLPIVVDDPLACLEMMHYGQPEFTRRLVFLVDPPNQAQYAEVPYEGATWLTMARMWSGVRAESLAPFLQQNSRFLLADEDSIHAFVLRLMIVRKATIRLVAVSGGLKVYLVTIDPAGL